MRKFLLLLTLLPLFVLAQSPIKTVRLRADSIYLMKPLVTTGKVVVVETGGKLGYIENFGTGSVTSVEVAGGTGISVSGSPLTTSGTITVTNTLPDQTVTLNAGTSIGVAGTYPTFTINNTAPDQTVALTEGNGIAITGTYPNFTIANDSTDKVVALNEDGTIDVTGTYPNFTIKDTSYVAGLGMQLVGGNTFVNTSRDTTISFVDGTGIEVTGTYPGPFTITNTSATVGTVTAVDVNSGTGISVTGDTVTSAGAFTVVNTAPDQTVTLTAGGIVTIGGTYPDFTVSASEVDGDITNEIQTLSVTGTTVPLITLSASGGTVTLTATGATTLSNSSGTITIDTPAEAYSGTVTGVYVEGGTGISIAGSPITTSDTITVTNTAPDQTVVLTEGPNITITGTYPSFTISSASADTLLRYSVYSSGNNNIEVLATKAGITATLVGTVITFTLPAGTKIISAKVRVENFSSLTFIMGTVDMDNSSMADRWMPIVQGWREDTGAQLSGLTTIMDLTTFTKFTVNGLNNQTKCQVRLSF